MPSSRILFDLSTRLRWSGPPAGIVRVEHELARWGRRHRGDLIAVFFDPDRQRYCGLDGAMADRFVFGDAVVDQLGLSDPSRRRPHTLDRVPPALRAAALWGLQSRRKLLQTLERVRLSARSPLAGRIDRLQRGLMADKQRALMVRPDGTRRDLIPADRVTADPVDIRAGDVLVSAGTGWVHTNIDVIARLRQERGLRFVLFCHDIIPILFPQFFEPAVAGMIRAYFDRALPAADLVATPSRRVEADVRAYCAGKGLALRDTVVVPEGADLSPCASAPDPAPMPEGLASGRYALFVSTIEPRKGHRLLADVWRRLLAAGVPQAAGFKLVFVGRPGWMVDDLMRELREPPLAGSLAILSGLDDATMTALYQNAAFCCYPSAYEGYGLPIVEAFHFGRAVLASSGGALPEVVGDFSPCLDPADEDAWYRAMKQWIEDPEARAPFEHKIRTGFTHPSWDAAAAIFFQAIDARLGSR